MRFFLISFTFWTLLSCSPRFTQNFDEQKKDKTTIENPYFSDKNQDYVYKAKINAFDNFFGGILIIKKIKDTHHRVVFTTEFGNKIFDFEFIKSEFKLNYIIESIDKKLVINALKKDFELLIKEHNHLEKMYLVNNRYSVYSSILNKKNNYYYFSQSSGQLEKIVKATRRKKKLTIEFDSIKRNIAKSITMQHHNFKMKTELQLIN